MFHSLALRWIWVAASTCASLGVVVVAHAQQDASPSAYGSPPEANVSDQAPGRVAQLAYLSGQVQFQPAGEDDWGAAELNRPMVIGDHLLTGDDGRAVLQLGGASVRLDNDTAFDFLNFAQDNVQIELSQGTLNVAVRQLGNGENFEVDTPTVAFVATAPGIYRVDDDPSGTGSMVTVFQGSGTVYGENGSSRQVVADNSYRFNDSTLTSVEVEGLPPPDDFDRFCEARDASYEGYARAQQRDVPPDMIGGEELDRYGQWSSAPGYGNVWYPASVPAGWAPYRYGRWIWVDPWGWTWMDDAPWGFAPFHYGRWARIHDRWGWVPGAANVQPVYAPAMVAFIGGAGFSVGINIGGGGPVAWFPLGPRDVYVPWFTASRDYFNRVNVTNIRNVYVNRTVINNYYTAYRSGRVPPPGRNAYAYRDMPAAVTAVPRTVFTGARPVHAAALKLSSTQLARARIAAHPSVTPGKASLGLQHPTTRPLMLKGRVPVARPVVARHRPPPRPVAFAVRQKAIAKQHGAPLTASQMQHLRTAHPAPHSHAPAVRLVATAPHAAAARAAPRPHTTAPRRAAPAAHSAPQHLARAPHTAPASRAATARAAPRPHTTAPHRAAPAARNAPQHLVRAPHAAPAPHRPAARSAPLKKAAIPPKAAANHGSEARPSGRALPSAHFAHPQPSARSPAHAPKVRPAAARRPTAKARAPARQPAARPPKRAPAAAARTPRQPARPAQAHQQAHPPRPTQAPRQAQQRTPAVRRPQRPHPQQAVPREQPRRTPPPSARPAAKPRKPPPRKPHPPESSSGAFR